MGVVLQEVLVGTSLTTVLAVVGALILGYTIPCIVCAVE